MSEQEPKPIPPGSGYGEAQGRAARYAMQRELVAVAMQATPMQPGDWLPYRARDTFNLFELACLMHRDDPERMVDALTLAHSRRINEMLPWAAFSPAGFVQTLEAWPRGIMGDGPGGTLVRLKTATASVSMKRALPRAEAQALAVALGYVWPPELEPAKAVQLVTQAVPAEALPAAALPAVLAVAARAAKETRQVERLAHCEANGLVFDKDPLRPLPYGIGKVAKSMRPPITRQTLSADVKAALHRRHETERSGKG